MGGECKSTGIQIKSPQLLRDPKFDSYIIITCCDVEGIRRQLETMDNEREIRVLYFRDLNLEYRLSSLRLMGAKIGRNVRIGGDSYVDGTIPILVEIGNNVTISNNVAVLAHDASMSVSIGATKIGRTIIGNNVFIGYGSIILCDVKIGNNVVIGAGSVVTRDIDDNSVCAGNPCRVIGRFTDYIEKNMKNMEGPPTFEDYSQYDVELEQIRLIDEKVRNGTVGYLVK